MFFSQVGFLLLEINEKIKQKNTNRNYTSICLSTLWSILSNPIVFMTIIGVLVNLLFNRTIPHLIEPLLSTLSSSFSAIAIFYLGFMMVNRIQSLNLFAIIAIVVLIFTKSLIFPLLAREVTFHLSPNTSNHDVNETSASNSFSTYAFLYGTFPTAPSIYFYLNKYTQVGEDILSPALVFGTIVSAPLMIISAKIISLQFNGSMVNESISDIIAERIEHFNIITTKVSFAFSLLTLCCLAWIVYLFITKNKYKLKSHQLIMCLILMQIALSILQLMWSSSESYKQTSLYYIYFIVDMTLNCSLRLILIVITLNVLIFNRLININSLKWLYYLLVIIIPIIIALSLALFNTYSSTMMIKFNKSQLVILCLMLCTIILMVSYLFIKYVNLLNTSLSITNEETRNEISNSRRSLINNDCLEPLIQSQLLNKSGSGDDNDEEKIENLNQFDENNNQVETKKNYSKLF